MKLYIGGVSVDDDGSDVFWDVIDDVLSSRVNPVVLKTEDQDFLGLFDKPNAPKVWDQGFSASKILQPRLRTTRRRRRANATVA